MLRAVYHSPGLTEEKKRTSIFSSCKRSDEQPASKKEDFERPALLEKYIIMLFTIFNQVLVLFLLMALGYILAKRNKLGKNCSEQMTFLLCYFVMPCVILSAFQIDFDPLMFHNLLLVALLTTAIHIICITIAHLLFNKKTIASAEKRCILRFSTIYSNCGFMGFPLLSTLIGAQGIFYGSAYNAFFSIFLWTHGFLLYARRLDMKTLLHSLLNPNILIAIFGMFLYYYSIKLPAPIQAGVKYVADLNTALSMIIIGTTMTKIPFSSLFSQLQVWLAVVLRNLLFPLLIVALLYFYGIRGDLMVSLAILSACPTAGVAVLFATLTGKDAAFPGKILSLSTLFSLLSMPLVIGVAKYLSA